MKLFYNRVRNTKIFDYAEHAVTHAKEQFLIEFMIQCFGFMFAKHCCYWFKTLVQFGLTNQNKHVVSLANQPQHQNQS